MGTMFFQTIGEQGPAGTGNGDFVVDEFTGDGLETEFTLSQPAASKYQTFIFIDGVYQPKDSYTVVTTTLTFAEAPLDDSLIEVVIGVLGTINVPANGSVTIGKINSGLATDGQLLTADGAGGVTYEDAPAGGALLVTGTRASPSAIIAGTGIAFTGTTARQMWFIQGSGGAVDVSANPQIAAATTVGQELVLVGRSDANTVTLEDGTGLDLNGDITLAASTVLSLVWDGTNWVEMSRSA
jgi:hypothetical protein